MKNKSITLMYHSIGFAGDKLYAVAEDNFRQQMKFVNDTMTQGHTTQACNNIELTFDDGLIDNYTVAFPILKKMGLKAYFFVIVSKIGTSGYMNWEQLKELKNAGMVIGCHGMTHKILTGLNNRALDYEIKASKMILEERLGIRIDYFSIPKGHYNRRVINALKEAGYKKVFTSDVTSRIAVRADWDLEYFIKVVNSGLSAKDRMKETVKNVSKRMLGAKRYNVIRNVLIRDTKTHVTRTQA